MYSLCNWALPIMTCHETKKIQSHLFPHPTEAPVLPKVKANCAGNFGFVKKHGWLRFSATQQIPLKPIKNKWNKKSTEVLRCPNPPNSIPLFRSWIIDPTKKHVIYYPVIPKICCKWWWNDEFFQPCFCSSPKAGPRFLCFTSESWMKQFPQISLFFKDLFRRRMPLSKYVYSMLFINMFIQPSYRILINPHPSDMHSLYPNSLLNSRWWHRSQKG